MVNVTLHDPQKIADEKLKYAVIAARYDGKWIFVRHKERDTWEIPGGHREAGEFICDTARRELWEETGANDCDLHTVAIYEVEKDMKKSYGMLYLADVKSLAEIPLSSEIAEYRLFETIPNNLTYPDIQPHLYKAVQGWLNMQSNCDEMWDVYDENRHPTGRLHRRGDFLSEGDYHLVVHVWVQNSRGEFLLTKRSPNKGFPNMWETTGGSAIAGDDSLTAALREVKEETGLSADPGLGKCLFSYSGPDRFTDVWLFKQDFNLDDVVLQEGETCDKMYASADKILELYRDGAFVPYSYLDKLFELAK